MSKNKKIAYGITIGTLAVMILLNAIGISFISLPFGIKIMLDQFWVLVLLIPAIVDFINKEYTNQSILLIILAILFLGLFHIV